MLKTRVWRRIIAMKDAHKALLVGLSSRILVTAVIVLSSFVFAFRKNLVPDQSTLSIISLFDRWDSGYYISIAKNGYPTGFSPLVKPEWAFFPFYPGTMKAASYLFIPFTSSANSIDIAGFVISNFAFFVSVYLFYKLTNKIFKSTQIALISTVFFSFWGGAVFYSAIYSEALFMALALAAFYYLEEDKLPAAALLGFLAAFTRSDGFLICIPFLILALQSIKNKSKTLQLLGCSAIVAAPFLLFQLIGYEIAGGVFPISVIARELRWKVYPVLFQQFISINPGYSVFYGVGLLLIFLPAVYSVARILPRSVWEEFKRQAGLLKYWGLYASMMFILLFESSIYSTIRYALPMLPIYWVPAIIYAQNRRAGTAIFGVMTGMLIIGCFLFEARGYFM